MERRMDLVEATMHNNIQFHPRGIQNIPAPVPNLPASTHGFREIPVKVHIRRPERDSWAYNGRAIVSHEVSGHTARVVIRSAANNKILAVFNEGSDLHAEKRENFVIVASVEGSRVVSWSFNTLNNSDTLRLLAMIELACSKRRTHFGDPRSHTKVRRRIEKVIKEDRRNRHKRRKDQDSMIEAFAKHTLATEPMETTMNR